MVEEHKFRVTIKWLTPKMATIYLNAKDESEAIDMAIQEVMTDRDTLVMVETESVK